VAPGSEPVEVTPAGVESVATAPTLDGILHVLGVDALAVDMFIKIDGIDGEATAGRGHEDWIQIESFSWGESQTPATGRARGRSQTAFSDLSVVKGVDAASPHLYQACANGKHYPTATLVVRKAGEPFDYFSIRLQDVRVSSVKLAHSTERDVPMEEVTLNYGKITWSYDPQDAKDGKVEKGWDLKANKGV
jgi:type VI secretion system secreted protein Hcp